MAFPFNGQQFTFTQPDNTQIKVKGWGNQYYVGAISIMQFLRL
jgi:hypothetical protein